MEDGRVNHRWCMGVVSDGYGGKGVGSDEGGGWCACRRKPWGIGRMSGDTGATPDCEVRTLMTPDL